MVQFGIFLAVGGAIVLAVKHFAPEFVESFLGDSLVNRLASYILGWPIILYGVLIAVPGYVLWDLALFALVVAVAIFFAFRNGAVKVPEEPKASDSADSQPAG